MMARPNENMPPPPGAYYYAPEMEQGSDLPDIHLRDYLQIVLQRLPLVLAVFSAIMLVAVLYTWTRPLRYAAAAQLLLDPGQINLTDMKGAYDPAMSVMNKRDFMETQARLIRSRPVLESVIEKLDLLTTTPLGESADPVQRLANRIQVTTLRNTHLIEVSLQDEDARLAARIVNAVVSTFLDSSRARRLGVSEEGLEELRQRAASLNTRLTEVNARLQEFMVEHNMVSFERTQNLVMDRLRELNRQLNAAEPRRMALQAQVEAARATMREGKSIVVIPSVMESQIVRTLQLSVAKLESEFSQLIERLGENHPRLVSIRTEIEALQNKIAMEASNILSSLTVAYEQTLKEEELLHAAIQEQEQRVYRFNQLSAEFEALRRTRDSIEAPYNTIIRRIEEIDINRIGGQGESMFVSQTAHVPRTPSWPSKRKNLMIAFVFAGALSVGLCFFLDYMDTTVKSESDVHRSLGSRTLAAIPDIRPHDGQTVMPDQVVSELPRSLAAEAFRSLRTAMTFSLPTQALRSVVVSSTLPGEGKSLVAANLAVVQASAGRRVLLIDGDLRKPRLHKVFTIDPTKRGLSECLQEKAIKRVHDFIVPTGVERLSFMPCGRIPASPAELLESDAFHELLEVLRESFDFVVIDSPPGFALVDSTVMARNTDGLLLVVRSFSTPKDAARQFVDRLREAKVDLLGVCLNLEDAPRRAAMYGRYGYYGRHGRYGNYYLSEESS